MDICQKTSFLNNILVLDIVKKIFISRYYSFVQNLDLNIVHIHRSPAFDMLNVALSFGFLGIIDSFIRAIPSKISWSDIVWKNAWDLKDKLTLNRYSYQTT